MQTRKSSNNVPTAALSALKPLTTETEDVRVDNIEAGSSHHNDSLDETSTNRSRKLSNNWLYSAPDAENFLQVDAGPTRTSRLLSSPNVHHNDISAEVDVSLRIDLQNDPVH